MKLRVRGNECGGKEGIYCYSSSLDNQLQPCQNVSTCRSAQEPCTSVVFNVFTKGIRLVSSLTEHRATESHSIRTLRALR